MKLDNIKIVFIDIDGTLVNDNKEVTLTTKKSIKRIVDKGIYVVLVSGRDIIHTIEKSKLANASNIVIATNGSEIFDYSKNEYIFRDVIDSDKVIKMWNYCIQNQIGLILKSNSFVYYNQYSLIIDGLQYKFVNDISLCDVYSISEFLIMSKDQNKIQDTSKFVDDLGLSVTSYSSSYLSSTNDDHNSLDVNNKNISKGISIKYLLDYLNIKKEDSLCFGDFVNDLEMFNASGVAVAMGNASDEVKVHANYVTLTNNEDGVAHFLDNYL